jgi:cytoskeletal protein CcmA (bactofilin family)
MVKHVLRGLVVSLVAVLLTLFTSLPVLAADLRGGDTITVASGEVVDDDLYIAGNTIIIDGTVNGDLWAFGSTITVNGDVNGSIVAIGQTVNVNGNVGHAVRLVGQTINISGNVSGDLIVFGSEANIASKVKIGGDMLFSAGNVRLNGPVEKDVKGSGSEVIVANVVGGDVELKVKNLTLTSSANVQGNLTYTSENEADIQSGAKVEGKTTHNMPEVKKPAPFSGIVGKLIGFLMALVTGLIIILIIPGRSASVADSIRNKPWTSLGWGAVILFATPIAAIMVCITVIGIPVGLIALALYAIAIYISQVFVGLFIGRWIIGRFRGTESKAIMVGALALGLVILTLLGLIPYLGFWIGLAVALFGLGAVLVSETTLRSGARQVSQT